MAHFALLWKARTIEKHRQNYENEKINSIFMSRSDVPDKTLFQKWKQYKQGMQKRLSRTFSKWYPEGSTVSNFFVGLRTDMKLPSILLRSFYGFMGGLCLTYLGFMFFVFQLSLSIVHATVLSSLMGVLLTLGLTFSNRIRCLILLLVPQLFSRVGRYTLTCYALVLILTGPATNTLRNCEVLSTSMACTQERIKLNVRQINDSINKPHNIIKNSLKITIRRMKLISSKLKTALIRIHRLIMSIASIIEANFKWLLNNADLYNDAIGMPHEKCLNIMNENSFNAIRTHIQRKHVKKSTKDYIKDLLYAFGIKNVKAEKHGNEFDFGHYKNIKYDDTVENINDLTERDVKRDSSDLQCEGIDTVVKEDDKNSEQPWFSNKAKLFEAVCASLKTYQKFFVPANYMEKTYVATIRKKLKTFTTGIRNLIYVHLNVQHTYNFISNSGTSGQVSCGVVTEIKSRADPILTWLSWSSCVTSLFILLIIFRAKHYQRMFETRSRFDNRFITKEFRELDLKRLREGRETVLPLNMRERAKYVTTTSFRLVASEKVHLNRSAVFMTITTFKLLIHIVADYSLYWVLTTIRYHGKHQSPLQPGIVDRAFLTGDGFISRLIQAFIDTMNAELLLLSSDHSCLPNPHPPDIKRYCQIGFLIFLLWFFALFEPYGLRLRHLIMGHYRPQRAKDRAVWLYNHILRTRASFMKFARRKLHREYKYYSHSNLTFRQWLQTYTPFHWLISFLGIKTRDVSRCLLCNMTEDKSDINKEMIKCEVSNCPGNYCPSCFTDIGQLCTICLSPPDYGDFSDASLEEGSSDENDSDENDDDDRGKKGSNRRNKRDEGYRDESSFSEEADDVDDASFSGLSKQKYYVLGRKGDNSETMPLLEHPAYQQQNSNKQYVANRVINDAKLIVSQYVRTDLCMELILRNTIKKHDHYNATVTKDFYHIHTSEVTSTINVFLCSVYYISPNPLMIVKYEYSSDFAKYLRKKKFIRRKKYISKKAIYWDIVSKTSTSKKVKKNSNNANESKDTNHLNKSKKITGKMYIPNIVSDDLNNDSAIYNNATKKELSVTEIKNRNTFNRSFQAIFTKYWKNMKLTILSFKCVRMMKQEPPVTNNKQKRKKTRKKTINLSRTGSIGIKLKKKSKFIENSRLFAYLDERDWLKSYESVRDLQTTEAAVAGINKNNIIVNNVLIPKLDLNLSSESINELPMRNIYQSPAAPEVVENKNDMRPESHSATYTKNVPPSQDQKGGIKIKRSFSKPISIVKNFYSSFLLPKNENKLKKLSNKTKTPMATAKIQDNVLEKNKNDDKKISKLKPENSKSKIKDVKNKGKKAARAVLFIKEDNTRNNNVELQKKTHKRKIKKNDNKEIQTITSLNLPKTDDKGITVCLPMDSCCSKVCHKMKTQDLAVQVTARSQGRVTICQRNDAESMTCNPTCTCATQYYKNCKEVGVCVIQGHKITKDVGTLVSERMKIDPRAEEEIATPDSSTTETLTSEREGIKTDTTIYSLTNVDCRHILRNVKDEPLKKYKVKVTTKSNRSTLTERARHCDVSTATYDWWSPILEKKDKGNKIKLVEKKKKEYDMRKLKERKTFRSKGIMAGEKIVTFRSKTQLIPSRYHGYGDIMSPSRYLLESQKYYNELFYNIFTSPRVYPVTNIQKFHLQDRDRSQTNSSQKRRRGRKTKRLEESYSPRKNFEFSPRAKKVARNTETSRRNKKI